ncbi:conserved hypothetical protein [Aspergillus terreus NIH2624]|uniref:NAD-dependent epimerase/dehydratase domain-containing protein n=1 Tax=Aspergillus terreus (strain NIH 2624 / FGSC A1156) TaxID=341663 RepID=Q0CSA6_ASPTN|nr:uncharacterized protein ATEG_03428 [Aspergillus terreus NIH2624]EAU36702.1 conserved hypothetical protein [Aspergillus terreus NIH2624]
MQSGYIGGDVLYELLSVHPDWEQSITCLVRNPAHEAQFRARYPRLRLLFATFDQTALIEEEIAKNELVVHFAISADNVPSATAIVNGLRKRGGGVYIHTSGTDILLDPGHEIQSTPDRIHIFDDWEGISELTSLPDEAIHRNIDKIVLAAGSQTLKTAIVCPSTVFGAGRGPVLRKTEQMYNLTRLILARGKGLQLSDGKSFWNCVHVHDLSRLYVRLIDEAVFGGAKASWNSEGYYLVESGEYFWGDICRRITKEAYKLGLLASEEMMVVDMKDREVMAPAGRAVANYRVKARAVRARKLLHWTPTQSKLLDEIPEIVKEEARAHGLS